MSVNKGVHRARQMMWYFLLTCRPRDQQFASEDCTSPASPHICACNSFGGGTETAAELSPALADYGQNPIRRALYFCFQAASGHLETLTSSAQMTQSEPWMYVTNPES